MIEGQCDMQENVGARVSIHNRLNKVDGKNNDPKSSSRTFFVKQLKQMAVEQARQIVKRAAADEYKVKVNKNSCTSKGRTFSWGTKLQKLGEAEVRGRNCSNILVMNPRAEPAEAAIARLLRVAVTPCTPIDRR